MKKVVILFFALAVFLTISTKQVDNTVSASSQNYLFFSTGCAHCGKVDLYFQKNNIFEQYNIEKKNTSDAKSAQEFNKICQGKSIPLIERGVPMLYFEGQCIIGDKPIIDFFEEYTTNANNDPNDNPPVDQTDPTIPMVISGALDNIASASSQNYLFFSTRCPHCDKVDAYFQKNDIFEQYNIEKKNTNGNAENAQIFNKICRDKGIPIDKRGVPMLYFEEQCVIGDKPIIDFFEEYTGNTSNNSGNSFPIDQTDLTIPMVISGALVDAINPCEFAVLILLLTTILINSDRKKSLQAGLAFSFSMFISYYLIGLGLYGAVASAGLSSTFMKIIGVLSILVGLFNLKDYFWYGKGFVMEVPLSWRPKMKKLIRSVTSPIGAFFVGFLVSLFLLPCTSGPYIVVMGMLGNTATFSTALWMLLLYNLIFISPMVLITIGVYKGLDPKKLEKLRSGKIRLLHLIAGLIMFGMGVTILWGVV